MMIKYKLKSPGFIKKDKEILLLIIVSYALYKNFYILGKTILFAMDMATSMNERRSAVAQSGYPNRDKNRYESDISIFSANR